ncbi:MAG: sarcosine oxidase subunit gamma family protein [Hyphomicrobiales bacterium]
MTSIKAPFKQSPLGHRSALTGDGVQMSERAHLNKTMLRGDLETLGSAVASVAGANAPTASQSTYTKTCDVHWIGPDTLMVLAGEGEALADSFSSELDGKACQVANISNNYTVIELSGARARDVLQKLSTLDLDAAAFGKGAVAGTVFAHSNVVLACRLDAPDTFDIVIRRSHADYLWCLIADAGYEYGFDKQAIVAGETLRQ